MSIEPSAAVRRVMDFVNTAEPQLGTDQLVPVSATACLQRLGLVPPDRLVEASDLPLLVGVREGLRRMLLGHAGHNAAEAEQQAGTDPQQTGLDTMLDSVPLTLHLADDTAALRAVRARAAHHVIAAVLTAVVTSPPEEWSRLKVCARDSCRWAFYDTSRNRSGRWCSMAGCGNIVKMRRAYRTRKQAPPATGS